MSMRTLIGLVIVLAAVLVASAALFRVYETEKAVLLQFGEMVEGDIQPGLHFKLPVAQEVKKFDARVLTLDSTPETYYTLEKKPLIVDSFVKWRVVQPDKFYERASFEIGRAQRIIQERVNEGLRNQISRRDMHEVISGQRDLLMQELTAELNTVMTAAAGVEVIDVRVKRIDLPPDVSESVYERMNSERLIEAEQYRAQGRERAVASRADAERQTVVIQADAYNEAEQIRGDGDAKAANTYAAAYQQDPEFYEFYRSINAYSSVFGNKGDLLILDPNSEFFKYLKNDGS